MHKLTLLTALALGLFALPARADFEGILEMQLKANAGSGDMKIYVGKTGVRNEMSIVARDMPVKMTMLFKKANPDVAYALNEAGKSYTEVDIARARQMLPEQKFTPKKLAPEKVNGWDCKHALLTEENGNETEVWTNDKIMDTHAFLNAVGQNGPANENMMKALKKVGAEGFVVKLVHRPKANPAEATTLSLVKAEKKSLPADFFEIPSGFTKAHVPVPPTASGGLPPEVQKQLMEQMKNMTPEQREMIEKAMRQQQQQEQAPH